MVDCQTIMAKCSLTWCKYVYKWQKVDECDKICEAIHTTTKELITSVSAMIRLNTSFGGYVRWIAR